jgi:Ankyrin repeats (3 copies)/Ankyrin repeats (many copies)
MASLTWQLYIDCDEIFQLKSLCPELGALNLQFRKAEDYVSQGILNRLMQDMLLNVVDGCYVILKELEQQMQEYPKLGDTAQQEWNDVVWCEDQVQWRVGTLGVYVKGLGAMNTNFSRYVSSLPITFPAYGTFSESRAVVVQKFLSYIEDMKSGRIEGSVLSQSLDYVTAEDGESELVWKSLRADLEVAGISTNLINKHRVLITTKFKEVLESGELNGLEGERKDPLAQHSNGQQSESSEKAEKSVSEIESDLSDSEVFLSLASKGHAKGMSAMIQAGIGPDLQNGNGHTALHLAASAGHVAVVELLLAQGATPGMRDAEGWTAMRHALENGHHSVLRAIVNHNPDSYTLDAKVDQMDHVILHHAVSYGDEDLVLLLLRSGANPNIQNRFGQTPLHLAAWRRDLIVIKHLLDADLYLDIEDFWGDTALEVAISSPVTTTDKTAVIRIFLESRLARDQRSTSLDVDLDDAVEFLTMESIYDFSSEDNIFKASLEGRNIAKLLPKQFEMNDLAEELFKTIYGRCTDYGTV